jgi:hypothetical protein
MDAIQMLHNAARHYCIEQAARWHRQYAELTTSGRQRMSSRAGAWDYTAEAYNVFPRYNVLDAIRRDVERFVPGDFGSVDELKSTLLAAGETAIVPGPALDRPVATRAADDERRRFAEFVRAADEHELSALPVLPFRRVLGEAEHRTLHAAFVDRWGVWYGGSVDPAEAEAGTVTLHEIAMDDPGAYDCLRYLLADHGVTRLLELREWGDGCEMDAADASFTYNGAEGFWTPADMGWMVYASHESSITFGGEWLVAGMRRCLPLLDQYIYRGWDPAAYPVPPQERR